MLPCERPVGSGMHRGGVTCNELNTQVSAWYMLVAHCTYQDRTSLNPKCNTHLVWRQLHQTREVEEEEDEAAQDGTLRTVAVFLHKPKTHHAPVHIALLMAAHHAS